VTGYFPENSRAENRMRTLEERLSTLEAGENIVTRVEYGAVDEQDWANCWKKYFKPAKVGRRIVVKPSWHDYDRNEGEIVLEIDPGMAFGTGTHPTTANCVRLLEKHLKKGDSFLDVGTGSGILMLAAHALGAGTLAGTDRDETAVAVAGQNLVGNGVEKGRFHLAVMDLAKGLKGKFDVIAANILSEVVVRLLDDIPDLLSDGGVFIASGIIEENAAKVREKMASKGLEVVETVVEDKWVAAAARKIG
jgi:ribosomal protein L11 methyltransferase